MWLLVIDNTNMFQVGYIQGVSRVTGWIYPGCIHGVPIQGYRLDLSRVYPGIQVGFIQGVSRVTGWIYPGCIQGYRLDISRVYLELQVGYIQGISRVTGWIYPGSREIDIYFG